MAQTTDGITFKNCKLEMSVNGSVWTDISGFAASVEVGGGERETGEAFTFDGDTPILLAGKRGALEVKAKIVYTEGVSEAQETIRAAYEGATPFYLRWTPKGTGFLYTTSAGIPVSPPYPGGEAESADTLIGEYTIKVKSITKS